MSEQMSDIEWIEEGAEQYEQAAAGLGDAEFNPWKQLAERNRRIAATLREYAELRERLEGLRTEAVAIKEVIDTYNAGGATQDDIAGLMATTLPADLLEILGRCQ